MIRDPPRKPSTRLRVNTKHIRWADISFVMEKKQGRMLREKSGEALDGKTVICLRIPDVYRFMEPALIDELKAAFECVCRFARMAKLR